MLRRKNLWATKTNERNVFIDRTTGSVFGNQ